MVDGAQDQSIRNAENIRHSSNIEPLQALTKMKKEFNRFSLNEVGKNKQQQVDPISETSYQDEAEAIKSNFSTEAQPN